MDHKVETVVKVGRNAPCPCGSGKKYKKCCLPKEQQAAADELRRRREAPVELEPLEEAPSTPEGKVARPEEVRKMAVDLVIEGYSDTPTDEIFRRLREVGIDIDSEAFLEDVGRFRSAEDLADHWLEVHPVKAKHANEDFLWEAAVALWARLAPDVVNEERLVGLVEQGYYHVDRGREAEGCKLWLQAWEGVKGWFTPEMRSIDDVDSLLRGDFYFGEWCQDMETHLGNAGRDDPSLHEGRIAFCRDFCRFFPETSELMFTNMRTAEAVSLFALGRVDDGERAFRALTGEYPRLAWPLIKWADMYCMPFTRNNVPPDRERAERLYRMAFGKDDDGAVRERLADLEGGEGNG